MKKITEKTIYNEKGKGKITFVTNNKFGDNHYVVFNKENEAIGKYPMGVGCGKTFAQILDLYLNGGSLA